jgi:D-alanine-D-alanine ligase
MASKKRIGLIFGGCSGEHEVSLASAASVIQHLNSQTYEVVPILITPEGTWLYGVEPQHVLSSGITTEMREEGVVVALTPDPHARRLICMLEGISLPHDGELDVLFPVLHGPNGEDGTIQGLFELADMPYVGCGVLGSAIGMDKVVMKQLFRLAGLPIVGFMSYRYHEWERIPETVLNSVEQQLSYPCFVKPANLGSSVGVNKAWNRQQLTEAIDIAFLYDRKIVVEQGLDCREFSCAVLGNEEPRASVIGEILPGGEFSDYNDKYINHTIQFIIPAHLPVETSERLREMALSAYQLLDLSGLARVDFFSDKAGELFYINEVNTLPGFTAMSLYPRLWKASGLEYPQLLDRLIELGLERYQESQRRRMTR